MTLHKRLAPVALAALLVACGPPEEESNGDTNNGGNNGQTTNNAETDDWEASTIESGSVGLHIDLAASPDGALAAAYFPFSGTELGDTCPDADNPQIQWDLRFAEYTGGDWAVENALQPIHVGTPPGLDLEYDGSTAHIATMIGDPVMNYCGAHDVGLLERSGPDDWSATPTVTESGEAVTGDGGSDFGTVVGYWPGLGFDDAGNAVIAYKDIHGGGLQADDLKHADLEMAIQNGGGFGAEWVDWGNGAGDYNDVLIDDQGRIVLVTYNRIEFQSKDETGVWVYRSADMGQSWERVHIFSRPTSQGPAIAMNPDNGKIHVVYYKSTKGFPELVTLEDDTAFTDFANGWTVEDIGDSRFDEGYGSDIAISPNGHIAVVYYRCTKSSTGELGECRNQDDGLIFAWEDFGDWTHEEVDMGEGGPCGQAPSLDFMSDGSPVIAYRCESVVDGELDISVKFAKRTPLP